MINIIEKLTILSNQNKYIRLYKPNPHALENGVNRLDHRIDSQLLDFLKFTNGASILDYCFFGFGNRRLGSDIDDNIRSFKIAYPELAQYFLPFMSTSTGDEFGYLKGFTGDLGFHPIAYFNNSYPDQVYLIATSYSHFMTTFLTDIEQELKANVTNELLLGINLDDWPTNLHHWLLEDLQLDLWKLAILDRLHFLLPSIHFH
jgi:hypothetical protein